jgi:hypothetical protein
MPEKPSEPPEPIKDTNPLNNFMEGETTTRAAFYGEDVLRIGNEKPLDQAITKSTKSNYLVVRDFFQVPRPTRMAGQKIKIKIMYLRQSVFPHQLMSAFHTMQHFTMYSVIENHDKQGPGKTMQAILVAWITMIHNRMRHSCEEFWAGKQSALRHLPENEKNADARCPSKDHWPFRCQCEPGSAARGWLPRLGSSLVVCLALSVIAKSNVCIWQCKA